MNTILQDIRCGRHSGFPLCCIAFFLIRTPLLSRFDLFTSSCSLFVEGKRTETHHVLPKKIHTSSIRNIVRNLLVDMITKFHAYKGSKGLNEVYYVICPLCVMRNRQVMVKTCNCGKPRKGKCEAVK